MAALDELCPPRKRIATYGKAVRKRQLGQDAFKTIAAETETRPAALSAAPAATEIGNMKNWRQTSLKVPTTVEMSPRLSESDDSLATKQKRKKVGDRAHSSKIISRKQGRGNDHRSYADPIVKGSLDGRLSLTGDGRTIKELSRHRNLKMIPKTATSKRAATRVKKVDGSLPKSQMESHVGMAVTSLGVESKRAKPDAVSTDAAVESLNHSFRVIQNQGGGHSSGQKHQFPDLTSQNRPSTPRKSTPSKNSAHEVDPSTSVTTILSPHGMKIWNELLSNNIGEEAETPDSHSFADKRRHFEQDPRAPSRKIRTSRRRLIDSLVEQSRLDNLESENFPHVETLDSPNSIPSLTSTCPDIQTAQEEDFGPNLTASQKLSTTTGLSFGVEQTSQISGPKITYSRQRSMLAEQELNDGMNFDLTLREPLAASKSSARRGSVPTLVSLQALNGIDETKGATVGGAIRTIHELRQAGAESRFKDEVEDLLDRIGIPAQQISGRRLALIDLAGRMAEKGFYSKFLSHGIDQRLFVNLGQEQDAVSGFILISLLMTVLDSGITPVAITQLRRQGITKLLIRLMDITASIIDVAAEKTYKISRSTRTMLSKQHENFLKLRVWDGIRPPSISPCTASLRCLELLVHQTREAGNTEDIMSKDLMGMLFAVLKVPCNGMPAVVQDHNSRLALSILESLSIHPLMDLDDYLPIIKDILEFTLTDHSENPAVAPLLRLVLNATDNTPSASNLFASSQFLHLMCCAIIQKFKVLSAFVIEGDRETIVDHLVLMLIVLINTVELSDHSRQASQTLHESNIHDLALIFIEYNEKSFEAKSVEESQLNVAGGYLAVFLGFLSLNREIGNRIAVLQKTKTLRPLIACIDEFICHHKRVDDLLKDEMDHKPQAGLTDRLQRLVDRLKGDESMT